MFLFSRNLVCGQQSEEKPLNFKAVCVCAPVLCDWQCCISQMLPHTWSAGGTAGTSGRDAGEVLCCTDTRSPCVKAAGQDERLLQFDFPSEQCFPLAQVFTAASCPAGVIAAAIGSAGRAHCSPGTQISASLLHAAPLLSD